MAVGSSVGLACSVVGSGVGSGLGLILGDGELVLEASSEGVAELLVADAVSGEVDSVFCADPQPDSATSKMTEAVESTDARTEDIKLPTNRGKYFKLRIPPAPLTSQDKVQAPNVNSRLFTATSAHGKAGAPPPSWEPPATKATETERLYTLATVKRPPRWVASSASSIIATAKVAFDTKPPAGTSFSTR